MRVRGREPGEQSCWPQCPMRQKPTSPPHGVKDCYPSYQGENQVKVFYVPPREDVNQRLVIVLTILLPLVTSECSCIVYLGVHLYYLI